MLLQSGTSIYSAMEGTVIVSTSSNSYGKYIMIENGELRTVYAHCNELLVKEGDSIIQGQEIAKVGDTGNATGPHLHFEVRLNDVQIDPLSIL